MNPQHFHAFLWLRWRLFANQVTRGGILNKILLAVAGVGIVLAAAVLLVGSFVTGLLLLPEAEPIVVLLVWDGLVMLFLFSWSIGLISELQRSEALSLNKFLHLPVSLAGAFTLNYLSSLVSLTMLVFAPAMIGLALGLTLGTGPALAFLLPAALAFLFMVTALTYQFQGWLASLMVNKRRRQLIIVMVTLVFVLIFQIPNLINVAQPWRAVADKSEEQRVQLERALKAGEITREDFQKGSTRIDAERAEHDRTTLQMWKDGAWIANMILPIGWLPWGAAAAMEGDALPGLLATLAYSLIGCASLWRAYRTTLRMYTGEFTSGQQNAKAVTVSQQPIATGPAAAPTFLEKVIPLLSEQAAVIALTGFRSLLRAPEVKMLLLSPIIMVVLFGGLFLRGGANMPEVVRPLVIFGGMAMILFTLTQLAGNQFGYDRGGFRIFVLSPAPRREILLGKNLALLPVCAGLSAPVVVLALIVLPLRLEQMLAIPFQFVSMFFIYCMAANVLSILAPMPVAVGSLKPTSPKLVPLLMQAVLFFALPILLSPVMLPWVIAAGLEGLEWSGAPAIFLVLTILEFAGIVALYRIVITWEGGLLHAREQKIVEEVVAKAE